MTQRHGSVRMCQAQAPISPIIHIHTAQYAAALVTITNDRASTDTGSLLTFVRTFYLQTKVLQNLIIYPQQPPFTDALCVNKSS